MLRDYLKSRKLVLWMLVISLLMFGATMVAYVSGVSVRAALIVIGLGILCELIALVISLIAHIRRSDNMLVILEEWDPSQPEMEALTDWTDGSMIEQAYQDALVRMDKDRKRLLTVQKKQESVERDYYAAWNRRIHVPIAAMRDTLRKTEGALRDTLMEDLHNIEHYAEMAYLYSGLRSGGEDYYIKPGYLPRMVNKATKTFTHECRRRKIRWAKGDLRWMVTTDEPRMVFILEQLLSNALKNSHIGEIEIFFEEPDTLCIRDHGAGMPEETAERAMKETFIGYRSGEKAKEPRQVAGLGLYLCKALAEELGHQLIFSSTPGKGTEARIVFQTQVYRPGMKHESEETEPAESVEDTSKIPESEPQEVDNPPEEKKAEKKGRKDKKRKTSKEESPSSEPPTEPRSVSEDMPSYEDVSQEKDGVSEEEEAFDEAQAVKSAKEVAAEFIQVLGLEMEYDEKLEDYFGEDDDEEPPIEHSQEED